MFPSRATSPGAWKLTQNAESWRLARQNLMLLTNPRLLPIQSTAQLAGQDADERLLHYVKVITGKHFDIDATYGDPAPAKIALARRRQQALCTRTE